MNIKISYDTIAYTTEFEFSNQIIKGNLEQLLKSTENKRITDWFENFAFAVLDEINGDSIDLIIEGCDLYEVNFIKDVLNVDKLKHITPIFENTIDDETLAQKYKLIDDFFYELANSDNEIVKDIFDSQQQENLQNWTTSVIELPVLATMSSGKSTFLNAMIGQDYLHEDPDSTTATICRIIIDKNKTEFTASAIDKDYKVTNEDENTSIKDFLKSWNAQSNENQDIKLQLEGPVKNLDNNHFHLHFIDTPGPNASENTHHQEKAYEYIKDKVNLPLVMYIIDPNNKDSNDQSNTFEQIREILKDNKQHSERIIFILNKIDLINIEETKVKERIINLKSHLEEKYEIKNPLIFPITSMYAKLAQLPQENLGRNSRKSLNSFRETINPEIEENYLGYQLLENAPLTENQKQLLWDKVEKGELNEDLVYSGLAAIKLYIEDYIKNHHKKSQYKELSTISKDLMDGILKDLQRKKEELDNSVRETKEEIEKIINFEIETLENEKRKLINDLSNVNINLNVENIIKEYIPKFESIKFNMINDKAKLIAASKILDNSISDLQYIIASFKSTLSTDSERILLDYLNELKLMSKNHYNNSIDNVRVSSFKAKMNNNINAININNFSSTINIIKTIEVESSWWIKRKLNWKDTITIQSKISVVNLKEIYEKHFFPVQVRMNQEISEYKQNLNLKVDQIRKMFISSINEYFEMNRNKVFKTNNEKIRNITINNNSEIQRLNSLINTLSKFNYEKI